MVLSIFVDVFFRFLYVHILKKENNEPIRPCQGYSSGGLWLGSYLVIDFCRLHPSRWFRCRAVIDIADIDISIKMSCDIDIDIENADIDISEFGVTPFVELANLTKKHEKALISLRPCKLLLAGLVSMFGSTFQPSLQIRFLGLAKVLSLLAHELFSTSFLSELSMSEY